MLFREIIAIYSENHTKSINTLSGQNVELKVYTIYLQKQIELTTINTVKKEICLNWL
jgi:hypothetical protein